MIQDNNDKHWLSPSSAARWTACPGSEYIISKLPRLPSSDAAEEGTLAHKFAAYSVAVTLLAATDISPVGGMPPAPEAALATFDITDGAQTYADAVCAKCGELFDGPFTWGVELPVDIDDRCGCTIRGRLDFAAWDKKRILIADYKFGGEFVSTSGNPQLLAYAMCVANERIKAVGESPDRVVIGIIQPRTELADFSRGVVWQTLDWPVFYDYVVTLRKQAQVASAANEKSPRVVGDHCRWCAARSVCRAAIGERLLLAAIASGEAEMTQDATDEQIGKWLEALRGMDTVREDLVRIAKARISSGADIPGWRIQTRKGKQWGETIRTTGTVPEQAQSLQLALGGEAADYITQTLKTPAAVMKFVPKEALAGLTEETVSSALVFTGSK